MGSSWGFFFYSKDFRILKVKKKILIGKIGENEGLLGDLGALGKREGDLGW